MTQLEIQEALWWLDEALFGVSVLFAIMSFWLSCHIVTWGDSKLTKYFQWQVFAFISTITCAWAIYSLL